MLADFKLCVRYLTMEKKEWIRSLFGLEFRFSLGECNHMAFGTPSLAPSPSPFPFKSDFKVTCPPPSFSMAGGLDGPRITLGAFAPIFSANA